MVATKATTIEPGQGMQIHLSKPGGQKEGPFTVDQINHDLAAGRLVHWGDVDGPDAALWALYPSRRLLNARVSAFLNHLREAFPKGTPDELAAFIRI